MGFSIGDIVVLLVVVVILAIYRQLDNNNRSLDKVKRFVERIQAEMDEIVAEKVTMLKDIGIEVDVHQKAAAEVLKRINAIEADLTGRTGALEEIGTRLTQYEGALGDLVEMTRRTEENIARVRDESEYVDKVGKRIKAAQGRIEELENALPSIVTGFEKQNSERLSQVEAQLLEQSAQRVAGLDSRVEGAGARVQAFSEEVARLQGDVDEQFTRAKRELAELQETLEETTRSELTAIAADNRAELEAGTAQIHALLETTAEELDRLAEKGHQLQTDAFVALKEHIAERAAALQTDAQRATDEALSQVRQDIAAQVSETDDALRVTIRNVENYAHGESERIESVYQALRTHVDEWTEETRQYVTELEQHVTSLQEQNRRNEEEQAQTIERQSRETAEWLENHRADIEGRVGRFSEAVETRISELSTTLDTRVAETAGRLQRHEDDVSARFAAIASQIETQVAQAGVLAEDGQARLAEVSDRMQRETDALAQRLTEITTELGGTIDTRVQTVEQTVLSQIEARLSDYEKELGYRFTRVESVTTEIDELEKSLRGAMDRISERIRGDFLAFGEEIRALREADRDEASAGMQQLRAAMDELETGLNELKQRAYDNVSEKLRVFEDEFFADLRARSSQMDQQISTWRDEVTARLVALAEENEAERGAVEAAYAEDLKGRLHAFGETIQAQLSKIDTQIESFRAGVASRMDGAEEAVTAAEAAFADDLERLREQSLQQFRAEFAQLDTKVREQMREFDAEMEQALAEVRSDASSGREEVSAIVSATRSDVAVWQTDVLNQLRSNTADVNNQLADARVRLSESLQALKREFTDERDELVEESRTARDGVKRDLAEMADRLSALERDLTERADSALVAFEQRHEALQTRSARQIEELTDHIDERSELFRTLVDDTRDQFQAMRDKLLGKLEEESRTLSTTVAEIEKRQNAFIEQTRIFERADSLKVSLNDSIEELKNEIARVESMRSEVRDIDAQFAKIRKMSAEAGEKMARFTADKRRIDLLEEDYRRLIGLAQSVESKIEQVGNSDEQLQEITARLRSLDDLQQEVEARFERLEKRRTTIDQTTDQIDQNAQSVTQIGQDIERLTSELSAMPGEVAALSTSLRELASARADADRTTAQLNALDQTLSDIEGRMRELQTAREWLARTETRLEEIRRDAGEQVKLLGSIMRDEVKKNPEGGGAPSLSARETVQKLAHQGWKVDEIARATKVSKGEVELILELSGKK